MKRKDRSAKSIAIATAMTKREREDQRIIKAEMTPDPDAVSEFEAFVTPHNVEDIPKAALGEEVELDQADESETIIHRHAVGFREDLVPYKPVEEGIVQGDAAVVDEEEFDDKKRFSIDVRDIPGTADKKILRTDEANIPYIRHDVAAREELLEELAQRGKLPIKGHARAQKFAARETPLGANKKSENSTPPSRA